MDIEYAIRDLNRHVAVSRKTLSEYLEDGLDSYDTKDGQKCTVERKDLELLAAGCTEVEKMRLRIPIFVSTDTSYEGGAWKVEGKAEVAIVARLLKKRVHTDDFIRIYYSDLKDLRNMVPSVINIVFVP